MLSNCFLLIFDLILRGMVEYRSLLQGIGEHHGEQALEGKLHGKARSQQDHRSCRGVLGVSCKVKLFRCAWFGSIRLYIIWQGQSWFPKLKSWRDNFAGTEFCSRMLVWSTALEGCSGNLPAALSSPGSSCTSSSPRASTPPARSSGSPPSSPTL